MTHKPDDGALSRSEVETFRDFQPEDAKLFRWLLDFARDILRDEDLSSSEVRAIVLCAFRDYARERAIVGNPQVFLARRTAERAEAHMELRGIKPGADEREPHLLDRIRSRASLDAMPDKARRALFILYYENGSYEDVAAELGVSFAYVERLVRKMVRKLEEAGRPPEPRE